jgi:hypothetical protein
MKRDWKRTKLSSVTFIFIFYAKVETNTEIPKTNKKKILLEINIERIRCEHG